jgi:hypothetical protein
MKSQATAPVLLIIAMIGSIAAAKAMPTLSATPIMVAQAMVPATGAGESDKPMPMDERMLRRYPQPVRVGDLIGLPMLDDRASTLGTVRQVVRTPDNKIKLIVSYSRWFGWFGHPVAVPIEAVGIEGRQLASLDMPRREYAAAPTWRGTDAAVLPNDATMRIALARN